MPEVLVAIPLSPTVVTRPYTFQDGISIREISPILWLGSAAEFSLSDTELADLKTTKYWLCASEEVEHLVDNVYKDLRFRVKCATRALQIICPSESKNVFLDLERTAQGYENRGSEHCNELRWTLIGRMTSAEDCGLAKDYEAVYSMVKSAFTKEVVRLQNPILLLEHGMQIGEPHLAILMFVMALDMLMMAGGKVPFVARLGRFLDSQAYVFPRLADRCVPDRCLQPADKVEDVLSPLFDLRNLIAHGREIPETPYREKYDLLDENVGRINQPDYSYTDLMLDSGLFLLAKSLRKISVENLFDEVCHLREWRKRLVR